MIQNGLHRVLAEPVSPFSLIFLFSFSSLYIYFFSFALPLFLGRLFFFLFIFALPFLFSFWGPLRGIEAMMSVWIPLSKIH